VVVVAYKGTPVEGVETLRRDSRQSGTALLMVFKNRGHVKPGNQRQVQKPIGRFGWWHFNDPRRKVAPAQAISNFAKTQPFCWGLQRSTACSTTPLTFRSWLAA